jgi:hypothetical protein
MILAITLLLAFWGCGEQQSSEAPEATPASEEIPAAEPEVGEKAAAPPATAESGVKTAAPPATAESGVKTAAPAAPTEAERSAPRVTSQPSEAPSPAPKTPAKSLERAAAPAAEPPPRVRTALIPSGTRLEIRLSDPVSSAANQSGDSFEAILDSDLEVDGRVLAPRGSIVMGKLSNIKQSGRVEGRATLSMSLNEIRIKDESYPIRTNTLAFEAEGTEKKDATKIGIGAGIGAVIGAIAGGGKGAAIGAAVGGGAGTATVLATRGKEVEFSTEELFSFALRNDLQVKLP